MPCCDKPVDLRHLDRALFGGAYLPDLARPEGQVLARGRRKLRPSAVAREMNSLATNLEKAAKAAERLGNQGMRLIIAASEANLDAGDPDMRQHILYLQRMASWSRNAAQIAQEHSLSAQDNKGGPTPTQELRELIAALMLSYQEVLGIRPNCHLEGLVAPRTRLSMLVGLKVMMQAMAPGQNWRWLQDACNRVQINARPSKDKRARMRPIAEIFTAAIAELERLPADLSSIRLLLTGMP